MQGMGAPSNQLAAPPTCNMWCYIGAPGFATLSRSVTQDRERKKSLGCVDEYKSSMGTRTDEQFLFLAPSLNKQTTT